MTETEFLHKLRELAFDIKSAKESVAAAAVEKERVEQQVYKTNYDFAKAVDAYEALLRQMFEEMKGDKKK